MSACDSLRKTNKENSQNRRLRRPGKAKGKERREGRTELKPKAQKDAGFCYAQKIKNAVHRTNEQ
jgi:hypothetical protein